MTAAITSEWIKSAACELGFNRCGIARTGSIGRAEYFRTWLESGRAGEMSYLHRAIDSRVNAANLLDGARSVIVTALLYDQPMPTAPDAEDGPRGRVAKYAWGADYHKVLKKKLKRLMTQTQAAAAAPFAWRLCVDTAPVIERELAAAAGIGWIGKNTMVLDHRLGSYFFLGVVITTLALEPDSPVADRCGTCTACLDACPTGAFPAPYEMDASRCISYLTIEHRGEISPELRPRMGRWVFGCDVCQDVCPHNRKTPITREARFAVRGPGPAPGLDEILAWRDEQYRERTQGSATRRATASMWKRNAGIALQNIACVADVPPPYSPPQGAAS